ncbi:LuxR C-terminal-related transcriptional regulator [Amycolatopsis sp. NPDC051061]|uniref:helix-turn-helix transcriptional regulator n=1 Tax=Amycolatopsis sp. NPDC051061 TaxID=3155042 RepID=UPI003417AA02
MVERDVNHPSILFWDNGNEGGWNTALDDDFGQYDPQRRAVLHPWTTFGGIDTSHYQTYSSGAARVPGAPFTRDELGASRLLRLPWLAGRVEDAGPGRAVVDVTENYHENRNSARSFGVLAAVRGLAAGDETEIRTAERLVRRRGDHELVLLSEPAVRRPPGWLREAYKNTRAGGAARTTREPEPTTATGRAAALSVTEREILQLIRTGQTNRQIARTIRMSEKTVESTFPASSPRRGAGPATAWRPRGWAATPTPSELDTPPEPLARREFVRDPRQERPPRVSGPPEAHRPGHSGRCPAGPRSAAGPRGQPQASGGRGRRNRCRFSRCRASDGARPVCPPGGSARRWSSTARRA